MLKAGLHYQAEDQRIATPTPSQQAWGVWMWRHTNLQPGEEECKTQYRSPPWVKYGLQGFPCLLALTHAEASLHHQAEDQ